MVGNGTGADKSDVRDPRVRSEVRGNLGPAGDGFDEVGVVSASGERALYDVDVVLGGPGGLFGALDHDAVPDEVGGLLQAICASVIQQY